MTVADHQPEAGPVRIPSQAPGPFNSHTVSSCPSLSTWAFSARCPGASASTGFKHLPEGRPQRSLHRRDLSGPGSEVQLRQARARAGAAHAASPPASRPHRTLPAAGTRDGAATPAVQGRLVAQVPGGGHHAGASPPRPPPAEPATGGASLGAPCTPAPLGPHPSGPTGLPQGRTRLPTRPRPCSCYATAQGPRWGLPGRRPEGPRAARLASAVPAGGRPGDQGLRGAGAPRGGLGTESVLPRRRPPGVTGQRASGARARTSGEGAGPQVRARDPR